MQTMKRPERVSKTEKKPLTPEIPSIPTPRFQFPWNPYMGNYRCRNCMFVVMTKGLSGKKYYCAKHHKSVKGLDKPCKEYETLGSKEIKDDEL